MNDATAATSATPSKPKTVYTPVVMADGDTVQFAGEQKINTEVVGTSVKFNFRNGKRIVAGIDTGGLTNEFAIHGITQKLRDEAAGEKDVDDAYEAVLACFTRLQAGEWGVKREGSGGFAGTSVLLQALMRAYPGRTIEEVRAYLGTLSHKDKITLRRPDSPLKSHIDAIEAEKAAQSPGDAAELLARFPG